MADFDWKSLLSLAGPAAGMFAGNPSAQAAFSNRWRQLETQDQVLAERKAQGEAHRTDLGNRFTMDMLDRLNAVEEPTQWAQLRDLAAAHAPSPDAASSLRALTFPAERGQQARLKEITGALGQLKANGIDPTDPDLANHVVRLKDGNTITFGQANALTATAFDPQGKPVRPMPTIDQAQSTEEERYLAKKAKEAGIRFTEIAPDQELQWRNEFRNAGKVDRSVDPGSVAAQFNDLLDIWKQNNPGKEPTAAVRTQLRTQANRVNDKPRELGGMDALYNVSDPKAIAEAIMRGDREPETASLGRPIGAAVDSILAQRGYNKAQAVTDWKATQRHVATLNGPQQLRLNQSINALPEMLDSVEALSAKWKGGRFPVLNRANLALAKNGAYGPEVASVANQLDAQIADVVADLGNVYMGGNSPTDHALGLAARSLQSDWSDKTLRDMVAMARKNVAIRKNSVANTGVSGASATNPYAPAEPPAAAPPRIRYDMNGKRIGG